LFSQFQTQTFGFIRLKASGTSETVKRTLEEVWDSAEAHLSNSIDER